MTWCSIQKVSAYGEFRVIGRGFSSRTDDLGLSCLCRVKSVVLLWFRQSLCLIEVVFHVATALYVLLKRLPLRYEGQTLESGIGEMMIMRIMIMIMMTMMMVMMIMIMIMMTMMKSSR
jgi:hypothetical protein